MLKIRNLKTTFTLDKRKTLKAVDGIDLEIKKNEVLGLVGESGCGKSVASLSILRLVGSNGQVSADELRWQDQNLLSLSENEMRKIRGKAISMIFQNPLGSLNPVYTIGNQMVETLQLHHPNMSKKDAAQKALDLFREVNITDAERRLQQYPHELSGGMAQRVMIAMALSSEPDLLIADEPTASLDVTIQAQIMRLLQELKDKRGMSILMISHDMGVIAQMCDRIAVMYLGKIVEEADAEVLFKNPRHPYTRALLKAIPKADPTLRKTLETLHGDIPSPIDLPPGCRFAGRCEFAQDKCRESEPTLEVYGETKAACFRVNEL